MLTLLCNMGIALCALPQWLAFHAGRRNPHRVQRALLRRILRQNSHTAFGREKVFARIASVAHFRNAIPVQTYEDIAPYIRRIMDGEQQVLTAAPVKLLEPTSGSRGPVKLIPYTDALRAGFQRGIKAWLFDLFLHYPRLLLYKAYWLVTPRAPFTMQSAVPIGFDNDSAYLGTLTRRLFDAVMVKPLPSAPFPEGTTTCLREQAQQIGLVSVWSPSILESLFHGQPPEFPHLQLISCWADAGAAPHLHLAHSTFPNVPVQPKGLLSTECLSSFPLCVRNNEAVLAYHSAFFEFQDDSGNIVGLGAVEQGKHYVLIVTTEGGLYRYNTKDRVIIVGFYYNIPTMRFVGRDDAITDFCGEKLHEVQLIKALDSASAELSLCCLFAAFSFNKNHYVLYIEPQKKPEGECDLQHLAERVEQHLQSNYHYANCICTRQLCPMSVLPVHNAVQSYNAFYEQKGMRIGDIKMPVFDPHLAVIFGERPCSHDAGQ